MKTWSDIANFMTSCLVTDSLEFVRIWSRRDEVFKVDLSTCLNDQFGKAKF